MKTIQTKNYKKILTSFNSQTDSVLKLVQRGLNVNTAIEQVFGVGRLKGPEINKIKKEISKRRNKIPIMSI